MNRCFMNFILFFVMIFTSTKVFANDFSVDGIIYNIISSEDFTCGVSAPVAGKDFAGDLVVPECVSYNGELWHVIEIGNNAFYNCKGLTNITLPNSIIEIGDYSFDDCSNLERILIPKSVEYIGNFAFYGCSSLTDITIPNSVTEINVYSFGYCSSLKNITIPNSVVDIANYAFAGCSALTNIELPKFITRISSYMFQDCDNLTNVDIPNSVTSIGVSAFESCHNLVKVNIPNSVTLIEGYVFDGCSALTDIDIPNSVKSIGAYVFKNCSSLNSAKISDSVKSIGGLFYNCYNLTSVVIGNSVRSIGMSTFYNCMRLTEINIPNSVTQISDNAFENCSSLVNINIPNSVTSIGDNVFKGCSGLKNLVLEDGTNSLQIGYIDGANSNGGKGSFYDSKIEKLYLGRNLRYDATYKCGYSPFCGITSLGDVSVGSFVTSLGNYLFKGCSNIKNLVIEDGINILDIGYSVGGFFDDSSIQTLYLGRNLTYDSESPFLNTVSLLEVSIGSSVTFVDAVNWYNKENLKVIHLKTKTPPNIDDDDFTQQQYSNVNVFVPEGVLGLYKSANGWRNFKKLQENIPSSMYTTSVSMQVIKTENGNIVVDNAKGRISVYDVSGMLVKSAKADGNRVEIAVPGSGVYIVRVGGKAVKVAM